MVLAEADGDRSMSEAQNWQRETALRKIREAMDQFPAPPIDRVFSDVAGYVGASKATVEDWWKGRGR